MRERLLRAGLAAVLLLGAGTAVACDREDQRDVEEVGNEIEKEIDEADTDGKDD